MADAKKKEKSVSEGAQDDSRRLGPEEPVFVKKRKWTLRD